MDGQDRGQTRESATHQPAVNSDLASSPSMIAPQSQTTVTLPRPAGPIEFTDVTAQAGIHFKHNSGAFGKKYLPKRWAAASVSWITTMMAGRTYCSSIPWIGPNTRPASLSGAVSQQSRRHVYRCHSRRRAGDRTVRNGCAIGDYDNDGYPDIYITAVGRIICFTICGTANSPMSPPKAA